jgi:hypothetical protein
MHSTEYILDTADCSGQWQRHRNIHHCDASIRKSAHRNRFWPATCRRICVQSRSVLHTPRTISPGLHSLDSSRVLMSVNSTRIVVHRAHNLRAGPCYSTCAAQHVFVCIGAYVRLWLHIRCATLNSSLLCDYTLSSLPRFKGDLAFRVR